jgi:hypothetical protein
VALVQESKETTPSLGLRLLADLRAIFGAAEQMPTADVLRKLCDLDESPWGDIRGKPLDARGLSARLNQYGIKPKSVRIGAVTIKGYERAQLWDAWQRYLGPPPQESVTSVTSVTSSPNPGPDVSDVTDVTHLMGGEQCASPAHWETF